MVRQPQADCVHAHEKNVFGRLRVCPQRSAIKCAVHRGCRLTEAAQSGPGRAAANPHLSTREGNFAKFSVFRREWRPETLFAPPDARMTVEQRCPLIRVDRLNVFGVSASAIIHIGCTESVEADTRIKHIRQLLQQPAMNGNKGSAAAP